jgi:hypothetical protein
MKTRNAGEVLKMIARLPEKSTIPGTNIIKNSLERGSGGKHGKTSHVSNGDHFKSFSKT